MQRNSKFSYMQDFHTEFRSINQFRTRRLHPVHMTSHAVHIPRQNQPKIASMLRAGFPVKGLRVLGFLVPYLQCNTRRCWRRSCIWRWDPRKARFEPPVVQSSITSTDTTGLHLHLDDARQPVHGLVDDLLVLVSGEHVAPRQDVDEPPDALRRSQEPLQAPGDGGEASPQRAHLGLRLNRRSGSQTVRLMQRTSYAAFCRLCRHGRRGLLGWVLDRFLGLAKNSPPSRRYGRGGRGNDFPERRTLREEGKPGSWWTTADGGEVLVEEVVMGKEDRVVGRTVCE
jgi:hypothetical protein